MDTPEIQDVTTIQDLHRSLYIRIPPNIVKRMSIKPSKNEAVIRTSGNKSVEVTFP